MRSQKLPVTPDTGGSRDASPGPEPDTHLGPQSRWGDREARGGVLRARVTALALEVE